MSSTTTVYIPRLSKRFDQDKVVDIINHELLVDIYRVDFVPIDGNVLYQSAFLYFDYDNSGYFEQCILPNIVSKTDDENKETFRLRVADDEFWWILPNYNPVPETNLNLHQIVENARLLQNRVQQLEIMVLNQTNQIDYLKALVCAHYNNYNANYNFDLYNHNPRYDYRAQEEEEEEEQEDDLPELIDC